MEVLEHRTPSLVGSNLSPSHAAALGLSTADAGGSARDAAGHPDPSSAPKTLQCPGVHEEEEEGEAGALDLFQPGGEADGRQPAGLVAADALRCQVKITTGQNLRLRIANHTARDVYVRLVGRQGRVSVAGVVALKEVVHLSQLEAPPTEAEQQDPGPLVYSPCASMLPTPVEDSQGGVDLLFSSPVQSPAWLLRELHADPDIQARLEAERERERDCERVRLVGRGRAGGALTRGLRLLSSNERANACLLSVARFVAVLTAVLLVAVPTLLLLLESDIDVSFLHEIRQTPEFEQFHYEYYCPLRRWALCKISMALENLWSD
ncbi:hypothetical protein NHX12_029027 [Muraenolepis orangiensis]|uniref:FERM domain containing 3 n=1 Tax=Muraenolepis orangiensis TaxID=630683 RepID=A0A9Q0IPD6_9TELE|nr:hypothetical protein NHX12_029027 [Muraenolepis orangiensis]